MKITKIFLTETLSQNEFDRRICNLADWNDLFRITNPYSIIRITNPNGRECIYTKICTLQNPIYVRNDSGGVGGIGGREKSQ
jgi:hypothetical protein